MLKSEIKVGQEYVLREGKGPDAPIQRVRIIQHVRGKKWKAEWIDPNPGLIDYVESQNLVVWWKERKAFLHDEERASLLRADNKRRGYDEESPLATVLSEVFESIGEKEMHFYKGVLSGRLDALDRVKDRAGFDRKKVSAYTYVDRHGTVHIPYTEALELAKAFCTSEPSTVLMEIESTERKWVQEGRNQGVSILFRSLTSIALPGQSSGNGPATMRQLPSEKLRFNA